MKKRLLIFDISNFIFRAFYAIRPLSAPDGTPVNAVYGVFKMMMNTIDDLAPTHVLVAQDNKGGSFRNEMYEEYKANRTEPPEELKPQFQIIEEMLEVLTIPKLRVKNFEADDVIGSAAVQFAEDFDEIMIASGDKDLMQFVDEKVKIIDTMKKKIYGRDEVFEKMGVYPEQIVDYLSLVGDSSDNIPGVRGIGAKGAAKLLGEYKKLEKIFDHIEDITNKRVLNGLTNHKDDAFLSKSLIEIKVDIDLNLKEKDLNYEVVANDKLKDFLEKYNFKSLIKMLFTPDKIGTKKPTKKSKDKDTTLPTLVLKEIKELNNEVFFIRDQVDHFIKELKKIERLAFHVKDDFLFFYTPKVQFCYKCTNEDEKIELIKKVLSLKTQIITLDPKPFQHVSLDHDFKIKAALEDFSLLHFSIFPYKKHDLYSITKHLEDRDFSKDEKKSNYQYLIMLQVLFNHYDELMKQVSENDLEKVTLEIDTPLNTVLSKMENHGIKVDPKVLENLSTDYHQEIKAIEAAIFNEAPYECNLKSPKQVAELLFDHLGLPVIKENKTGPSTDASVLNALEEMDISPVPSMINKFREIDKLLSTYIDSLPKQINNKTKRIHTNFNQTGAATGRLSSDNPNLQNIPIKSAYGKNIRKAFVAPRGSVLLAADYSQVELRILAHFSEDPTMLHAFKNNLDIHTQTASEVFDVPVEEMTDKIRSNAKAINFGLIYGQSSFGLSETLGISRGEASEYITHYFQKFSHIKSYLDSLKEKCEDLGYSETIIGRKRFIPEIKATNRNIKAFGERMAINSPIQGTAADILKLAMLKIQSVLEKKKMKSKMLLQVHDELIFEVPKDELDEMLKLVPKEMEGIIELKVPLKVDVSTGKSWYEL